MAGDRYQVVLHVDVAHDEEHGTRVAPGEGGAANSSRDESDHGVVHSPRESAQGLTPSMQRTPASAVLDASVIECGGQVVDVSTETSRRLACDAAVVVIREGAAGAVLDVGRKTRTVPPAIRRALDARDTGCRFPGCTARRCDAHHVVHWAEGGPTCLDNLLLLCRRHHRLLHEGGYTIRSGTDRTFTFVNAVGRIIDTAPSARGWTRPSASTDRTGSWLRPLPTGVTGRPSIAPTWDGTPFTLAYVIDALRGSEPLPTTTP